MHDVLTSAAAAGAQSHASASPAGGGGGLGSAGSSGGYNVVADAAGKYLVPEGTWRLIWKAHNLPQQLTFEASRQTCGLLRSPAPDTQGILPSPRVT
jgi:hypothetical protein